MVRERYMLFVLEQFACGYCLHNDIACGAFSLDSYTNSGGQPAKRDFHYTTILPTEPSVLIPAQTEIQESETRFSLHNDVASVSF